MTSLNFAQLGKRICELLEMEGPIEGQIDITKARDGRVIVAKAEAPGSQSRPVSTQQ
jgi:hypothetical protein